MTTTKTTWVLKRIDEMGNCYHELEIHSYVQRNSFVREWIGDERNYTRTKEGDVDIILKRNGEELWVFERTDEC